MSPIEATEFESKGVPVEARERVDRKNEVLTYLTENLKSAFTQKEVADHFDMQQTQARSVLMALIEDGKVRRKEVKVDESPRIYYAAV
jgi:predicted ArsR family transcriptional regulator